MASAYNLVTVFALPISESVPHIYLSVVSISKTGSPVAQHYSKAHPVIKVHTIGTKTPSQCIKVLETGRELLTVAVSPDERLIASGWEDEQVRVRDIDTGELISGFKMDELWELAFSPNNKYIVSASKTGTLSVWNLDSRKRISTCSVGVSVWADVSVAFSPNAQRVIVNYNGNAYILDFCDGKLEHVPGWFKADTDVEFHSVSRDGKHVVGNKGWKIAIWDSDTGKQISGWIRANRIWSAGTIAVSSDGKRVVVGSEYGIDIWNVDSVDLVASSGRVERVHSVAFSPDGTRIVVGSRYGDIAIFDADTGDVLGLIDEHRDTTIRGYRVEFVHISLDGKRIISASEVNIRIWDVGRNDGEITSSSSVHTDAVYSVAFSPDGKRVVSGSDGIRIWDADSGELINGPFRRGNESYVISVAFSPDGQRVASCSHDDNTVRIWDANNGKQLLSLKGHTDSVQSVTFSTDGKRIASGSMDNTVRIWDAHTGELVKGSLKAHTNTVRSVSFADRSFQYCPTCQTGGKELADRRLSRLLK